MYYSLPDDIPWHAVAGSWERAEAGIAALDARLGSSPVHAGWQGHADILDACASVAWDGTLVTREDLVLRDAFMDIRHGTQELGHAHHVLRARRSILRRRASWAFTSDGIAWMLERRPPEDGAQIADDMADDLPEASDVTVGTRYGRWLEGTSAAMRAYPTLLAAALAWDAWRALRPLGRGTWLGRLLIGNLLRLRHKTRHHLLGFNIGLQRLHYHALATHDLGRRLAGGLDAMAVTAERGMALLLRLETAKERLAQALEGRRSSSRLPEVVDLLLSRPVVSVPMIARDLRVSRQAATQLIDALQPYVRELTGRGRYRAWGVA